MKTDEIKSLILIEEKYTVEKAEQGKKIETLAIAIDFDKQSDSVFIPKLILTYGLYVPKANVLLPLTIQVWYELITTNKSFFNDLRTSKVIDLYCEIGTEAVKLLINHFDKMKHTNERLKDLVIPNPDKGAIMSALVSGLSVFSGN